MIKGVNDLNIEFSKYKILKITYREKNTKESLTIWLIRLGQVDPRRTECEDKVEELGYAKRDYQNLGKKKTLLKEMT